MLLIFMIHNVLQCVVVPFAYKSDLIDQNWQFPGEQRKWLGTIDSAVIGKYVDDYLLLICGGVPWQV